MLEGGIPTQACWSISYFDTSHFAFLAQWQQETNNPTPSRGGIVKKLHSLFRRLSLYINCLGSCLCLFLGGCLCWSIFWSCFFYSRRLSFYINRLGRRIDRFGSSCFHHRVFCCCCFGCQ